MPVSAVAGLTWVPLGSDAVLSQYESARRGCQLNMLKLSNIYTSNFALS